MKASIIFDCLMKLVFIFGIEKLEKLSISKNYSGFFFLFFTPSKTPYPDYLVSGLGVSQSGVRFDIIILLVRIKLFEHEKY